MKGEVMFDQEILSAWLTKKSDEILSKLGREVITTEDMLILILRVQINHFYQLENKLKNEFSNIHARFDKVNL